MIEARSVLRRRELLDDRAPGAGPPASSLEGDARRPGRGDWLYIVNNDAPYSTFHAAPRRVDDEVDDGVDEESHGFDEGDDVDAHSENDGPDHGVDNAAYSENAGFSDCVEDKSDDSTDDSLNKVAARYSIEDSVDNASDGVGDDVDDVAYDEDDGFSDSFSDGIEDESDDSVDDSLNKVAARHAINDKGDNDVDDKSDRLDDGLDDVAYDESDAFYDGVEREGDDSVFDPSSEDAARRALYDDSSDDGVESLNVDSFSAPASIESDAIPSPAATLRRRLREAKDGAKRAPPPASSIQHEGFAKISGREVTLHA